MYKSNKKHDNIIYTAVYIGIIVVFAIFLFFVIITLLTLSNKTTDAISFIHKLLTPKISQQLEDDAIY